uniref:Transient receptor potential cation channel, subfamily M, member 4a n=1 Tax=Esox lucius TaxID=8010 RepID=A0A6Q2XD01_ESOLU
MCALNISLCCSIVSHWDSIQHSSAYPTDAFGELEFEGASRRHSKFLRLSCDTPPSIAYKLLTADWGLPLPNLVVSVVGGEGRAKVKMWVREVLRQGLVKASQSTGAWILTEGLREGVGRCVGEAVRDHAAAASSVSHNKVVALGIAPWGLVKNREQLVNPQGSFPAKYYVHNTSRDSCSLDINYQAFLLVDDGTVGRRGGEAGFRAQLEDYISKQRTGSGSIDIPVLCMLISGEKNMLKRLDLSLKQSMPWMVLAGSGGVADLVSNILESLSSSPPVPSSADGEGEMGPTVDLKDRVAERVRKHFPSETEMDKLVEQVLSIYQNKDLITVYHGEQEGPDDFDTVLLKALVQASKQRVSSNSSPYTEELKLAVAWNRVDIAKSELFNADIQWKYEDLEDSMTDALINDKPQFVRLFTENGLNILDYMTYGRLESLYCSVTDSSLAYSLLQRRLGERQGIVGSQVSRVLEDIMGDVCQPFYHSPLELENITSQRKALKLASRFLQGDCQYRKTRCLFPWASLFIWAVLQNRSNMAVFFWEMTGESVLSALSACKILRELSRLESEAEAKLAMKELAQRFENLAHDVFSKCYQSSESRSFTLLIRKSPMWGGTTCLEMGIAADARLFFSHDGVQSLLSQIWWGDMKRNTAVWKLLLTFFCPVLMYTHIFKCVLNINEKAPSFTCKLFSASSGTRNTLPKRPFILSRWRQFWFAPVTSFLGNVLMYFMFLLLFAYVLLVDFKPPPPLGPAFTEYITCWPNMWNTFSLFAYDLCVRMFQWSYESGRAMLCVDYMVFTLRLIHIFAIHKQLGPKIIIVGKMMKDIFFFLFFLGVWLMAYGVANQALLYSYDPRPSWIFRRVFYRPYLHIYGQVPVEEIDVGKEWDTNCTDNLTLIEEGMEPCRSEHNNWLVVILLVIYLLVTNILLVNLLIAMFSYTFSKVQGQSDTYWKFQRYNLIVEYHSRPSLAPPFIILSHVHLFIKRYIRKVPSIKILHFVLEVDGKAANKLMTWEAIQKESFLIDQSKIQRGSDSERLKRMSVKVDNVLKHMAETRDHDRRLRALESELEYCSSALSWIVETLSQSNMAKPSRPPPTPKGTLPCFSSSL